MFGDAIEPPADVELFDSPEEAALAGWRSTPPADVELFDSPEEAALAGWRSTPPAHAHVISVQEAASFDGVYVTIRTDGRPGFHDRDISACARTPDGRWWESGSVGA